MTKKDIVKVKLSLLTEERRVKELQAIGYKNSFKDHESLLSFIDSHINELDLSLKDVYDGIQSSD